MTNPSYAAYPPKKTERSGKIIWILLVVMVVVGLLAMLGGLVFLFLRTPHRIAQLRDVLLIVFSCVGTLMLFITGVAVSLLAYQVQHLVVVFQQEIKPTLRQLLQTATTVRTTSSMVSNYVAKPLIKTASLVAGFQAAKVALRRKTSRSKNADS